MKYGAELSKRSVPEWKAHNIDYNELKHLIKRATQPNPPAGADDDLLNLLKEEFESVNLFVKSKSGEIDRRIDDCERIVDAIAQREKIRDEPSKRIQSKLLRLHRDVSTLTYDIQSLSRFIGAQRTGFRKLLKKYKKWSNSNDALSTKFLPILESSESFINQDLTSKFLELSLLYGVLRDEKFTFVRRQPAVELPAKSLCRFDCEMISSVTQQAMFWVHQDNIVELKVHLLQHLSLYSDDQDRDETSVIYLDDKKFHSLSGNLDPGQIRWVNQNTGNVLLSPTGGLRHFTTMTLNENQVDAVLSGTVGSSQVELNTTTGKLALGWVEKRGAVPVSKVTCQRTRFVYSEPTEEGTPNLDKPFIWVTLDNQITMTRVGATNTTPCDESNADYEKFPHAALEVRWKGMNKPDWVKELESSHLVKSVPEFSVFAHTIATFHQNALQQLPSWLRLIKENKDIRKTPHRPTHTRNSSMIRTPGALRSGPTTPLGNSILLNDSNGGDYFSRVAPALESDNGPSDHHSISSAQLVRQSAVTTPYDLSSQSPQKPVVRYWNEFDDPEDGDDADAIFIEPEDRDYQANGLFSRENIDSLVRVGDKFVRSISRRLGIEAPLQHKRRVRLVRNPETDSVLEAYSDNETDSLLDGEQDLDETRSISSDYSPRFKPRRKTQGYDSFPDEDFYVPVSKRRDAVLTFLYSLCFFISALTICVLFGVISGEDMDAVTYGTYLFVLTGLLFGLAVGVLGMCLFMLRDAPSWWHQTIVLTVFFSVVCFSVGGIAWIIS